MFPTLNLPPFSPRLRQSDQDITQIFDPLRQRFVKLTPEEWVRQHFVNYLISEKQFPQGLMGNEVSIALNGVRRRCDTVLFDRAGLRPRVIVEYKAPDVAITQQVFTQIQAYNSLLRADYLVVSNGLQHYVCKMNYEARSFEFLPALPHYSAL